MATFNNNETTNGGTIYSEISSNITFKATCKVILSHTSAKFGGSIVSYNNSYIVLS